MSAGMYGADPEQLSTLGSKLSGQVEVIDGIITLVTTQLSSTVWQGPARTQFEGDWSEKFLPSLNGMKASFGAVGLECSQRALNLAQLMGARASAT